MAASEQVLPGEQLHYMEPKEGQGPCLSRLASPGLAWPRLVLGLAAYCTVCVQGFALLHERKCRVLVRR